MSGSVRNFILRTGDGGLDLFPISAIPAGEPLGGRGTAHDDTLHWRQDAGSRHCYLVAIQCNGDDNEPSCLDTSRVVDGENPVVHFYPSSHSGHVDRTGPSFIDFYEDYFAPCFADCD
ncbi:hypothetical protein [Acidovorax sp. A79]|uniref:hypothetical protein n=1 Tax=Acidovorax sp. A79 TaxID=3056107 RepID=UPI0034E8CC00